ncbi:MAG: pyridoxamine 5'-phosphate oxidase family protein [Methanomassiliicoccus sp.]|nr:pyridoxamine 5'-phosphate oxidase family protein [Methanomassiliicoccus sp.]
MRLREKEITDRYEIEELLTKVNVCRMGLCDGSMPYVVPTTFGYRNGVIYLHSSKHGRKIDVLRENNRVCIAVDTGHELVQGPLDTSCKSTIRFKSVIATGRAKFVEDEAEKKKAMDVIMAQAFGDQKFEYAPEGLRDMAIIKIELETITGKKSGY